MKFTPFNNRIHVERVFDLKEEDNKILLPDEYKQKVSENSLYRVLGCSLDVKPQFKIGSVILVEPHSIEETIVRMGGEKKSILTVTAPNVKGLIEFK